MPELDAVIAITSGTRDMARVMNLVWDLILPGIQKAPLAADPEAQQKLAARLASVTMPMPAGALTSPTLARIAGKRFQFEPNAIGLETILVERGETDRDVTFTAKIGGSEQRFSATGGAWTKGTMSQGGVPDAIATRGAWTTGDTYTLKVVRYRTPFATTYRMRFSGDLVVVNSEQNVGFGQTQSPQLVGAVK
jgi:hypothetical protein